MAECKGPFGKTAVYRLDTTARYGIKRVEQDGTDGEARRQDCRASRRARRRLSSPPHRRALRCMLGI